MGRPAKTTRDLDISGYKIDLFGFTTEGSLQVGGDFVALFMITSSPNASLDLVNEYTSAMLQYAKTYKPLPSGLVFVYPILACASLSEEVVPALEELKDYWQKSWQKFFLQHPVLVDLFSQKILHKEKIPGSLTSNQKTARDFATKKFGFEPL